MIHHISGNVFAVFFLRSVIAHPLLLLLIWKQFKRNKSKLLNFLFFFLFMFHFTPLITGCVPSTKSTANGKKPTTSKPKYQRYAHTTSFLATKTWNGASYCVWVRAFASYSYFVLTRDYLHCFKRASGSANERISDMGQFIFKVSDIVLHVCVCGGACASESQRERSILYSNAVCMYIELWVHPALHGTMLVCFVCVRIQV